VSASAEYEVRYWVDPQELHATEYADYWNDETSEREKEWWTENGDFAQMEGYLEESGLAAQLDAALAAQSGLSGEGADLASGTLWAIPRLLSAGGARVYAIEYSLHRLLKIGPGVLKHYGVPADAVVLCLGSFYKLELPSRSLDFVLLAQALHHADRPRELLAEVRRVLKPTGVVIVIGEKPIESQTRHFLRWLISFAPTSVQSALRGTVIGRTPLRRWRLDPVLGDHLYTPFEYRRIFRGFAAEAVTDSAWLLRPRGAT
jgi:SAM-dependent methyltransferase